MTSPFGKNIINIAKLQILFAGSGLLTQIFLARYLGPEQKGTFDLFLLVPTVLASIIDLGLLSANTYFAGKKVISIQTLHSHSLLWSLLSILVLFVIFIGLESGLLSLFHTLSSTTLLLSILLAGPTMYFSLWSALMYGIDRVRAVYQFNVVASFVTLFCYLFIAFFLRLDLLSILYVTAGLNITKTLVALVLFNREQSWKVSVDPKALKTSLRYSIVVYLGLIINTLHFRIDQFFVSAMLGSDQLGIYALAVRIAEMVWLLDYSIINASTFRVTSSSPEEASRVTQRVARLVGTLVFSASIMISLVAPFLIPVVFGKEFSPAIVPLVLLFPGILAWSLARVLGQFVVYQSGKPWFNLKASAVAFLVNLVLIIILIPAWGITGAAIASSVSYVITFTFLARAFKELAGSNLKSILIPTQEDFVLLKTLLSERLSMYVRKP